MTSTSMSTARWGVLALMASLAAPMLAPADANAANPNDVWRGTDIDVNALTIVIDGETKTSHGLVFPKQPNTFDITIPLAHLGLPTSEAVVATGTANGSYITWTFDKHFSIDLGGADDITRVWGWFTVQIWPLPPSEGLLCIFRNECFRNASLDVVGSQIFVQGDTTFGIEWTKAVELTEFDGRAGVPKPRLAGIGGATNVTMKKTSQQTVTLTGWLTTDAPSTGTSVDIRSSAGTGFGFAVPSTITVPGGHKHFSVPITIDAGFGGKVELVFTTPGSQRVRTFTVGLPAGKKPEPPWTLDIPDWVAICLFCPTELIDPLNGLVNIGREMYWLSNGDPILLEQPGLSQLDVVAVAQEGWMTGTARAEAGEVGFVAQFASGEFASFETFPLMDEYGGWFVPQAVDAWGNVSGHVLDRAGTPIASLKARGSADFHDLGVPSEGSMVTAMNDSGYIVGTTSDGDGFVAYAGMFANQIRSVDGDAVVPTAVNEHGELAGHLVTETGRRAMTVRDGRVQTVTGLSPRAESWVVGITAQGWILGNVIERGRRSAFIRMGPSGEATQLDDVLADRELHATAIVQVTESDLVVLEAVDPSGAEALYLLQL
jgi:hypothetical protein